MMTVRVTGLITSDALHGNDGASLLPSNEPTECVPKLLKTGRVD
jgi:hypothetical protein